MLTPIQIKTFQEQGILRLDDFLPAEAATPARQAVQGALARHGLWREGAWHLEELESSTSVVAGSSLVKGIKSSRTFAELVTRDLLAAVDDLVDGQAVYPMMARPQLLFTLPNAASWSVPHTIWHLDLPRVAQGGISGVQMFTFLDTVEPRGGGTLLVAGSHRLLNSGEQIRSKNVKRRLKREPYFRDLMSRHMTDRARFMTEPGDVHGVEVRVVEMHGKPGDVYLTDMRMLHTLAPNASRVPRMMLTQRFLLESMWTTLFGDKPGELDAVEDKTACTDPVGRD